MSRIHPAATYLALKNAVRRACESIGPLDVIAQHTRLNRSSLARCYAPARILAEEQYCPIDVALDLDHLAGEPVVLRAPAAMDSPAGHLRGFAREASDLLGHLGEAVADGAISPAEAAIIDREAAEVETVLFALRTTARALMSGEGGDVL